MSTELPWWAYGDERARPLAFLGAALALSAAVADLLLTKRLSLLFDLCFITTCAYLAWRVRPYEFFTIGVLPPLLMLGTVLIVATTERSAITAPDHSLIQAVVTGLAQHAFALGAGYFAALAILAMRARELSRSRGIVRILP